MTQTQEVDESVTGGGTESVVELRSVSKFYDGVAAVDDVSLEVGAEFYSLLGPSGSGKTTLLRIIAGFAGVDHGTVVISGQDVTRVPPYRRPCNTVFQQYALFPHLTVAGNIAFGLKEEKLPKREIHDRVGRALELVQLPGAERRSPRELSGGQQQRVALARALVKRPRVLLLDEPLAALDAKLRKGMQTELKRLQQEVGISFVYVTHDQEEALVMSDRIAIMSGGRVQQIGSPREIYDNPASPFVADFIGQSNLLDAQVLETDGDKTRLRLAAGGEATVLAPCTASPGSSGQLMVRPEDVTLSRLGSGDGAPGPAGQVVSQAFLGSGARLQIVLADGTHMVAVRDRGHDALEPGDQVQISWSSATARFFPAVRGSND